MTQNEKKFLKTIYELGKRISKPSKFEASLYQLSEVLRMAGVKLDDVTNVLESPLLLWVKPEGIQLTSDGVAFCQNEFENRPIGFNLN